MWYLILTSIFVVWISIDAHKRKTNIIPWAIGAFFLGPIIASVYFAKRPLMAGETREGGSSWNILKNFAILWTIFMATAAIWGLASVGEHTAGLRSESEKAGAAIGTALGLGMIASIWFFPFIGSFLIGFILRKSSVVEKGPVRQGPPQNTEPVYTIVSKRPISLVRMGIAFFGIVLLILVSNLIFNKQTPEKLSNTNQQQSVDQKKVGSNVKPDTEDSENWSYNSRPDKMGRGIIKGAATLSVNTISFGFPYSGEQHGTLALRIHPQYGKDVILSIERGQFLSGIDGCKVLVRFDDGKPLSFWANEPSDHSTTTIFISDYPRFVAGLKRAKSVLIEAPFFQEGKQVFEFNVVGLKWETEQKGKKK